MPKFLGTKFIIGETLGLPVVHHTPRNSVRKIAINNNSHDSTTIQGQNSSLNSSAKTKTVKNTS